MWDSFSYLKRHDPAHKCKKNYYVYTDFYCVAFCHCGYEYYSPYAFHDHDQCLIKDKYNDYTKFPAD